MICNECETVAHCTKHGCIPKQPAPMQDPPPECQTEAEKRAYAFGWWKALEAQRALDKKAENARELGLDYEPVLKDNSNYRYDPPVAEPVATIDSLEQEIYENTREFVSLNVMEWLLKRLNTTPPAAQPAPEESSAVAAPVQKRPQNCGTGHCSCIECVMEPAPVQEPVGYLFQHEETGLTTVVDVQQVEWGFEKNNPRHQKIGPVYTTPPAAQPAVPDAITDRSESPEYIQGWNDCRAEMLRGMKP